MPVLLALLTVLVGVAVGIVLMSTSHVLFGFVAIIVAVPAALAVWVGANDRLSK
jgi:hypothetical protein